MVGRLLVVRGRGLKLVSGPVCRLSELSVMAPSPAQPNHGVWSRESFSHRKSPGDLSRLVCSSSRRKGPVRDTQRERGFGPLLVRLGGRARYWRRERSGTKSGTRLGRGLPALGGDVTGAACVGGPCFFSGQTRASGRRPYASRPPAIQLSSFVAAPSALTPSCCGRCPWCLRGCGRKR